MTPTHGTGATILCALLERLGIEIVFGLPGSETIELFEALRRSKLRTVLTADERGAAFAANGYYRASGKIAAVVVIGGPGFTNALTGLAEARHDSAGLLCIVVGNDRHPEKRFRLQAIDHRAMAAPVVKKSYRIGVAEELPQKIGEAVAQAITGEPGPVMVEMTPSILQCPTSFTPRDMETTSLANPVPPEEQLNHITELLSQAGRVVLYAGQGAAGAADHVRCLAETLHSPVLTTCSGRGIISENHPLSFFFDYGLGRGGETINELLAHSDVILALGCKFTHNGSRGFRLRLPQEKLVHVDASAEVLGANYPARLLMQCDVPALLARLVECAPRFSVRKAGWTSKDLGSWKARLTAEQRDIARPEPLIAGDHSSDCSAFFASFRDAAPDEVCIVTDTGLHQTLTRTYFQVRAPRGMIVPADFQSMGFGVPAAIGAKLAAPDRRVVAIVGDGGFAMTGMELTTAVREKIPLTIIVFTNGKLGSIRLLQFEHSGWEHAVTLHNPDYAVFAESLGVSHVLWDPASPGTLADAVRCNETMLIEVPLVDSPEYRRLRTAGRTRAAVRRSIGPRWMARMKRLFRR